jgi:type II secretory pathway component PulJ
MSAESLITIFSSLAFGPAVAVVLLRWVLTRATSQDARIEQQASEIATLQARVEELEGDGQRALVKRLEDSVREESRLVTAIDTIGHQATRLASAVDNLERAMALRTCQLPAPILARVQEWMRDCVVTPKPAESAGR